MRWGKPQSKRWMRGGKCAQEVGKLELGGGGMGLGGGYRPTNTAWLPTKTLAVAVHTFLGYRRPPGVHDQTLSMIDPPSMSSEPNEGGCPVPLFLLQDEGWEWLRLAGASGLLEHWCNAQRPRRGWRERWSWDGCRRVLFGVNEGDVTEGEALGGCWDAQVCCNRGR